MQLGGIMSTEIGKFFIFLYFIFLICPILLSKSWQLLKVQATHFHSVLYSSLDSNIKMLSHHFCGHRTAELFIPFLVK